MNRTIDCNSHDNQRGVYDYLEKRYPFEKVHEAAPSPEDKYHAERFLQAESLHC